MNLDSIKTKVLSRLVGNRSEQAERWSRDEIDKAIEAIASEAVAAVFGEDPAAVVSGWILRKRHEQADRIHAEVLAKGSASKPTPPADVLPMRKGAA